VTSAGPRWSSALLTGATHGIGAATALSLCPLVDVLLLHGPEPAAEVERFLGDVRRRDPTTDVSYHSADYGRLSDVGALIASVRDRVGAPDLLINNAGRPGPRDRRSTVDGNEITFQTNYLAPVALTSGLLELLGQREAARIINVASATHYSATLRLDDLGLEHDYGGVAAYAHSKLAIVTYTCWLARQLDPGPVEAVSIHPGVISTGLLHAMFGSGGDPVAHGARNIVRVAQEPRGVNGVYFDEDEPARPNPAALDVVNQRRLVELTAQALGRAGLPTPLSHDGDHVSAAGD
jgi:NAD(P)-dependent dehydrogenase (short-subunit alcohol dehydrogenase family)